MFGNAAVIRLLSQRTRKDPMKNKKLLGNVLLLITALIWGTAFSFQRVGMESVEPITFCASRMALAAIAVGLIAFWPGKARKSGASATPADNSRQYKRDTVLGGICCGCFLGIASIVQQVGIVTTTAGKAGFITAMYILLVPILGFVLFKRRNTWLVWFAVLLGVIGMYLLCVTKEFTLARGDALVCVCALFFSGHILCCDYFSRRGNPLRISAIQFMTATALSAAVAALTEKPSLGGILDAWLPILYCGIVSGGIGYTLQMVAQKYTEPTAASLLMSMEAVFAVIAGALLLGERMSAKEFAGCAVMLTAIILVQLPPRKKGFTET